MRILIKKDNEEIGHWTANYLIKRITEFQPNSKKPFVLGLPTGSSPITTYEELIRRGKLGDISFKNVITFNLDEYVGIPESHPQSYHTFMNENFFSQIDIPAENIHILNGNAEDLDKECIEYEDKILKYGGIEILLGGIGMDGHIAFNEPGSSLNSRTRIKSLCYDTIEANSRFFDDDVHNVPTKALTMGIGTIMDAREVVIFGSGYKKARAIKEMVGGAISHMWPASILQMHQECVLVCDEEATMELEIKTVKYFKDIEDIAAHSNHP
ncbi:glucosamine-6-phosphate deaminase [Aequorivita sp. H23M31]|uniref:Glucosamine-6-phosphate deaminase n=1 Tax=Aequorivita ciconiae TaxID=2494375 RepID=A0A410G702_9FLAO|nr:glucosamine-6-phosphate deaminase [Aequorivita sp. H23M31]QAA83078.1 glucosamine-6-phosphate deaminase [Aequorivita sp. H23M31]